MADHTFPNNQPVVSLDCSEAFDALSDKEKSYAHYLSRASWYGGLVVLVQTSPESPVIFSLLQKIFKYETAVELKKNVLAAGLTEDDYTAFLVYCSGFYCNMGNYKGFGDTKFVPNFSEEKFDLLIKNTVAYSKEQNEISHLWSNCRSAVYSLDDKEKQLGLDEKGITTYFSKNCTKEDAEKINRLFKEKNLDVYNSRGFKLVDNSGTCSFEVKLASVIDTDDNEASDLISSCTFEGSEFKITRGDYSPLLKLVIDNLECAKKFAANETEVKMLNDYIYSFKTGSLQAHKDGSCHWVKNKAPVIETYIGFIETYRDPTGMRGEFEGFVAMVNKPMSEKFANLVQNAQEFLPLLPWDRVFEKDKFLQPDFTSLDVLTFAGSGIPAGICIPNYDEIRQNEGFKNVSLGNVIPASYKDSKSNYLSDKDQELFQKYLVSSFEVNVGLHELLGHGSGKLFMKNKDGTFNFEENNLITGFYEVGETFDSVFQSLGSPYEECKAECVALYLCTVPKVLKTFGCKPEEYDDMIYVIWLSMFHKGLEALQMFIPKTGSWMQAHAQARYVIARVLLEAGEGFCNIEKVTGDDGKPDFLISMDRDKILTVGRPAIGRFLNKLQLYKSTANIKEARAMFNGYSEVNANEPTPFLLYKDIVMERKKPRKMFVQANTRIEEGGRVKLITYEPTYEGLLQSWKERFLNDKVEEALISEWEKNLSHFG